jgi:hypothetical protein
LAAIQEHSSQVPRALVVEFDQVLTALETQCSETRATSPSLGDIAVSSVAATERRGRAITLLEALRSLENSIHEGADMKIECVAAAARLFDST